MKTLDDTVMLVAPDIQNVPQIRTPLVRRIMLHWLVRLLITWFGFGFLTAATVAGLQALSVELSPTDSLFQPLIQGNHWLSGGAFGIEASVIAIVLGLGLGIAFLVRAVQQKRIMRGLWWRGGINVLSNS